MKNLLALLSLAALALSLQACAGEARLSESEEYYVGRSAAAKTLSQYSLYNPKDPELVEYLTFIGYAIAFESNRPEIFKRYNFIIVESEEFNACAFPSGFIMITTGTIKQIKANGGGEDELAAIVAHEIAHVNLRHPEIAANQMYSKQETAKTLSVASGLVWEVWKVTDPEGAKKTGLSDEDVKKLTEGLGELVNLFGDVVNNGYGRDQELAADVLAVDLMNRAGYNPQALKRVLSKLPKSAQGWLAPSHPTADERIKKISGPLKAVKHTPSDEAKRKERFQAKTRNIG